MESSDTAVSIVGLLMVGAMVLIGLACLVFWVWMLIHALTNPGLSGTEKLAWVLVVLFVNTLGALIYFFVGRPKAAQPRAAGPP